MALIIVLTNQSALAPISDYNYEVLVGDGSPARSKTLASGAIRGYQRSAGWQALVQQLLDEQPDSAAGTLQTALRQLIQQWRVENWPPVLNGTVALHHCADQLEALLPALEPTP